MTTIEAADSNVLYSPYTWQVGSSYAKTIDAGAYLTVTFDGTPGVLSALFDMSLNPTNPGRVGFRVDGGPWQDSPIAASVPLTLDPGLTWGTHTVEMVFYAHSQAADRWINQVTACRFAGISADSTITSRPTRPRSLYGLLVGDSIAEGIQTRNLDLTGSETARFDARLAWAYPLRDLLGAEVGVVGFGAVGLTRNGNGNVPRIPDSVPYLWDGTARNLSTPQVPDFIAMHIGTNDTAATDAEVTTETARTLNGWLASTPETTKVFVIGNWLQRKIEAIQAGITASTAPSRIVFIDTTGWWSTADASDGVHPYGYVNITDLAPRLAATMRPEIEGTGGDGFIPNVFYKSPSGAAAPLTAY